MGRSRRSKPEFLHINKNAFPWKYKLKKLIRKRKEKRVSEVRLLFVINELAVSFVICDKHFRNGEENFRGASTKTTRMQRSFWTS